MKHVWTPHPDNGTLEAWTSGNPDEGRVCKLCGATQWKETEQLWMRVTGYRWLPIVGRCNAEHANC